MSLTRLLSRLAATMAVCATATAVSSASDRPNIVFLLSDDQDLRLGSMEFMETLQNELVSKGANFLNHHVTSAQCCPSRVALLRGQAAHNTNITNVFAPGGNYEKFTLSGENDNYLPHWLKKAGYRSEYIGKFLNGVNILNWEAPPKGWDHIEYFVEPYQTTPNRVVMSENGNHPIAYLGYHQTDVVRAKALDRLDHLTEQEDPFFLFLSPTAPHVDDETGITVPCTRHEDLFPNITAPRTPSYNPSDEVQANKVAWIREVKAMNEKHQEWTDLEYRRRAQALVGIDEMLSDILEKLEEKGVLDNTYIIYSSDNGYHLGQHRLTVGKATPFVEDTNVPLVVRGPGVPAGVESELASANVDFAATFLAIAGVSPEDQPEFLDGRSLLSQWDDPSEKRSGEGNGNKEEIINVEYWGGARVSIPGEEPQVFKSNSYHTLRIAGQGIGYLYSHWCESNEVELYNTVDDPYEIKNLAMDPDETTARLLKRLNAILLVSKSCSQTSCRDPWQTLSSSNATSAGSMTTLKEAMDPKFDQMFDSFPQINVQECLGYQLASNEMPFWPPESESLGTEYRNMTPSLGPSYKFQVRLGNDQPEGGPEQRHATLAEMLEKSRELTKEELDPLQPRIIRSSD